MLIATGHGLHARNFELELKLVDFLMSAEKLSHHNVGRLAPKIYPSTMGKYEMDVFIPVP